MWQQIKSVLGRIANRIITGCIDIMCLSRYGLPVNFQAMLLQPNKKTLKKLREVLNDLYKHLDSSAAAIIDVSIDISSCEVFHWAFSKWFEHLWKHIWKQQSATMIQTRGSSVCAIFLKHLFHTCNFLPSSFILFNQCWACNNKQI